MPLPAGLRALSHRGFRVFLSGQIVSLERSPRPSGSCRSTWGWSSTRPTSSAPGQGSGWRPREGSVHPEDGYPLIHAHPPWTFLRVWRSPGGAGPVPRLAPRVSARRACAGAARRAGPEAGAAAHPHDDRGNESLTGGAATRILDALRPPHLLRELRPG